MDTSIEPVIRTIGGIIVSKQVEILSYLRSCQDEMIELLGKFTDTDSPSTDKPYMDRFAELVAEEWKALGANVTTLPQEQYGNHVKAEWGSGSQSILVLCHMDTVWDAGETKKRPFRVEDGKAYGPGAYDMKAGIIQGLFAVKALIKMGLTPGKRIVVYITLTKKSDRHHPAYHRGRSEESCCGPSVNRLQEAGAETWRKGVGDFTVSIKGRASHAGADYEKAFLPLLKQPTRYCTCIPN